MFLLTVTGLFCFVFFLEARSQMCSRCNRLPLSHSHRSCIIDPCQRLKPYHASSALSSVCAPRVHANTRRFHIRSALKVKLHLKGKGSYWDSPAPNPSLIQPPPEWGAANGAGGCNVTASVPSGGDPGSGADVVAFTGPQLVGDATTPLILRFDLTLTPFRTANQTEHWRLRHFQVLFPPTCA
jgi:hypothetical protein